VHKIRVLGKIFLFLGFYSGSMYGTFFLIYFIIQLAMHFRYMTKFYRNERKGIRKILGGGDNHRFEITSENVPEID
jgi:hypothetical protein